MDEILKCCGEQPVIRDHKYDFDYAGQNIPLWTYTLFCIKCGHHIHSIDKNWENAIPVWNNSIKRMNPHFVF